MTAATITWSLGTVPAATDAGAMARTLVVTARAATLGQDPEVVWKDLSTTATLTYDGLAGGDQIDHPRPQGDPAGRRLRDRALRRQAVPDRAGRVRRPRAPEQRDLGQRRREARRGRNDPGFVGSTFNLYQEMSYGQLFPQGSVPSAGIAYCRLLGLRARLRLHDAGPHDPTTCGLPRCSTAADAGRHRLARLRHAHPGRLVPAARHDRVLRWRLPGLHLADARDRLGLRPARQGRLRRRPDRGSRDRLQPVRLRQGRRRRLLHAGLRRLRRERRLAGPARALRVLRQPGPFYDNIWPHSSSLEAQFQGRATGLRGYISDDQLKSLHEVPQCWRPRSALHFGDCAAETAAPAWTDLPVYVRVGPYNVNPETVFQSASVISHEYGHHLGLPDFYDSAGSAYGDLNLMAADYSQHMTIFSKQELGWVVPDYLQPGESRPSTTGTRSSPIPAASTGSARTARHTPCPPPTATRTSTTARRMASSSRGGS